MNGYEGLNFYKAFKDAIDLVLLDLKMLGMLGNKCSAYYESENNLWQAKGIIEKGSSTGENLVRYTFK